MQSAKWDPKSERCIFVGYDTSGIHQLWNRHRVIRSKDVILHERSIQLSNEISLLPSNAIILQKESLQPSCSRYLISMKILDESLGNDGGDGCDHSYMPINPSHANSDSSLTSLASTPNPTPTPNQSLTPVSSVTSLRNIRHQIPTKLPPGFEHTAWLTTAYLAGFDAGISDHFSYSEAMSGCNATQWKLGFDCEFDSLDENNTWKLIP